MSTTTPEDIARLLGEAGLPDAWSARRAEPADGLHLEVKGVGRIAFPVPARQAKRLCEIARPARFGQGEKTLLDRRVRDTWEIPKRRVKIDKRRWNRTLLPVLEGLGADLGLPAGCRLKAELHAMLVYAPGQFFLPHQDSEKADDMVATLVVTLPSSFTGGGLVIEHQGERVTYRGSKKYLSFVAFYPDCRHQVRPVKEGYRVVLTYNLLRTSEGRRAARLHARMAPATLDVLAERVCQHFETLLPPRFEAQGAADPASPSRLVYLLDHQYTERGLGWQRLKGTDVARAEALRIAAERADCEVVLALAETHERWSCFEPGWDGDWYGQRHRSWRRDADGWYDEDPPAADHPDAYQLDELIERVVILTRWLDPAGAKAARIETRVEEEELCATTPSSALEAYASEYEGYMGNYGNTMDRWYRRAAIVLWPRELAFAVRAEASPAWALAELGRSLRAGRVAEARERVGSLGPFWDAVVRRGQGRGFFGKALRIAAGIDEAALATLLLAPFQLAALTPDQAPAMVAVVHRYGEDWAASLVSTLASHRLPTTPGSLDWTTTLPRLCAALCAADEASGRRFSALLVEDRWASLRERIEEALRQAPPSLRDRTLTTFATPIAGILEGAEHIGADALRDEALDFLCAERNDRLLPGLVRALRSAAERAPSRVRASPGLDTLRQHCVRRLKAHLARPERDTDDWSIEVPDGCRCELCATLGAFLADAKQQDLEWPLAKQGRMHVHSTIDAHELPIHHTTRRRGRPFTLVLAKTRALFDREAQERRRWQSDFDWLIEIQSSR